MEQTVTIIVQTESPCLVMTMEFVIQVDNVNVKVIGQEQHAAAVQLDGKERNVLLCQQDNQPTSQYLWHKSALMVR